MPYLLRPNAPPRFEDLDDHARRALLDKFDAHPAELIINGQVIAWNRMDEVEIAKAARQRTLSGWFVRHIVYAEERYHVGVYSGSSEAVLPNLPLAAAQFVVLSIAYYMQAPVRYSGVEGLVPVSED